MVKIVGCLQKIHLERDVLAVKYVIITDEKPLFSRNSSERVCLILRQFGINGVIRCRFGCYDVPTLYNQMEYSKISTVDLPIEIKISVFDMLLREEM